MNAKSISQAVRDWFLEPVLKQLTQMEANIMSQLDDLNAAIQAEDGQIAAMQPMLVKMGDDIKALLALVAAGSTPADLTAQIQAIQSHVAALTTANAQLVADDAAAKPPTA